MNIPVFILHFEKTIIKPDKGAKLIFTDGT